LDFGTPAVFEPQRAIAMRRARRLAAAAMLAASIGVLGLLL
jgi:hypothetical protein